MDNHGARPEVIAARRMGIGEAERHSATLDADFLYVAVPIPEVPGAVARVALPLYEVNAAVAAHPARRRLCDRECGGTCDRRRSLCCSAESPVRWRICAARREQSRPGRLDVVVRPAGARELGDLAHAFNAMAADLRRLITEQERSRARLEATLANLNEGVIITDEAGTVVRLNAAASRMLGTTSEEAVGQPFVMASRDHDLAGLLNATLAMNEPRSGDRCLRPRRSGPGSVGAAVLRWRGAARAHGVTGRDGPATPGTSAPRIRRQCLARAAHPACVDPCGGRDARSWGGGRPGGGRRILQENHRRSRPPRRSGRRVVGSGPARVGARRPHGREPAIRSTC